MCARDLICGRASRLSKCQALRVTCYVRVYNIFHIMVHVRHMHLTNFGHVDIKFEQFDALPADV